ncbi:hypothetical protein PHJA_001123900 [Phtheirospermum japonicum]|uniref:Uncharacterized protein n=1 Tax=Phtheirospermum japonicum TaxID=374723 RepID=A0A830C6D0_9LAMI|nr:hypothetical protein PHJA_001123900 [Phtheirospermum japonicum]
MEGPGLYKNIGQVTREILHKGHARDQLLAFTHFPTPESGFRVCHVAPSSKLQKRLSRKNCPATRALTLTALTGIQSEAGSYVTKAETRLRLNNITTMDLMIDTDNAHRQNRPKSVKRRDVDITFSSATNCKNLMKAPRIELAVTLTGKNLSDKSLYKIFTVCFR